MFECHAVANGPASSAETKRRPGEVPQWPSSRASTVDTRTAATPTCASAPRVGAIGEPVAASGRRTRLWLLGVLALAAVGAGVYGLRWLRQPDLPRGFASGNGRIEATAYDIATKRPGRIAEVRVHEGDMVEKGQILARIDTADLEAARREAEAGLQQAHESEHLALALVAQRASERKLAQSELSRTQSLVDQNVASEQSLDRDRARNDTSEAAARAAQEQVHQAKAAIAAATAAVERIKTDIDDARSRRPSSGRVLYRLAEPGEVLAAGGPCSRCSTSRTST